MNNSNFRQPTPHPYSLQIGMSPIVTDNEEIILIAIIVGLLFESTVDTNKLGCCELNKNSSIFKIFNKKTTKIFSQPKNNPPQQFSQINMKARCVQIHHE